MDDPSLDFFGGDHKALLDIWLNPPASSREPPGRGQPLNTVELDAPESPLASVKIRQSLVPWEDPRVQEYGSQDFLANRAWVRLSRLNWVANAARRVSLLALFNRFIIDLMKVTVRRIMNPI